MPFFVGERQRRATMRFAQLKSGERVPALGVGTWKMGEHRLRNADEIAVLKLAFDLGLTLVDTAEMYGEGGAELIVGEAVRGRRDGIFIVSKVYPHNASAKLMPDACERSLKRLNTDRIDLYLLHWKGSHPLAETVSAFERLKLQGKIRHWGVSNFDVADMHRLQSLPAGSSCIANQVLYSLEERSIEWDLLPHCLKSNIALMAYCPLGQGRLAADPALLPIARKHGVAPAAVALAWFLRVPGVIAIPKTSKPERMRENAAAADLVLDRDDLAALDKAYPPPTRKQPLPMT
jgi:diketogulonate reductase-like aldo/keto reductase